MTLLSLVLITKIGYTSRNSYTFELRD